MYKPYEEKEIPNQMTQEDLRKAAELQSDIRYDPQIQQIDRSHPTMQRQGMEAMAAKGLGHSGIGVRESMIPIAQTIQRKLSDALAQKGQFAQGLYDQLHMGERDRTDRLSQQDFANYLAKQNLGLAHQGMGINQFQALAPYMYGTWAQRQELPLQWTGTIGEVPGDFNVGGAPFPSLGPTNASTYVGDRGTVKVEQKNGNDVVTINGLTIDVASVGGYVQNGQAFIPGWIIDYALSVGGGK